MSALLEVSGLVVDYRHGGTTLRAVDRVDLELARGRTLGVVGESGCGKSTVARAVLRLVPATAGTVRFDGVDLGTLRGAALRAKRRDLQVVFQDPAGALNPRMTVEDIVAEPLWTHEPDADVAARVARMLARVGLDPALAARHPHALSGGQAQRVAIARALVHGPKLVVCDEAVSALDVTVRKQVVQLLRDLQRESGIALLFIAHDLAVVRDISDDVLVMYLGRVVEYAPRDALFASPRHPYTRALLDAVPVPDPVAERGRRRVRAEGDVPSPLSPPSGCAFRTRCPFAEARCAEETPPLRAVGASKVACHLAERLP